MPCNLGSVCKHLKSWILNFSTFNNLLKSPILVGLLITFIVIVLIFTLPVKEKSSFSVITKILLYAFIANTALILLHTNCLRKYYKNKCSDENALLADLITESSQTKARDDIDIPSDYYEYPEDAE